MKIRKSGKFYLKMQICEHKESIAKCECIEGVLYSIQFGIVTTLLQVFWLWWILEIDNKIKTTGYGKAVFEDVSNEHLNFTTI